MSGIEPSELAGKRALVTGAGQGVGAGVAHQLAAAGAHVVVNDYFPDRAEAVVDEIRTAGGSAEPLAFDVTDHEEVRDRLTGVGGVDVLVNNAGNAGKEGFGTVARFVDSGPSDWAPFLDVNLHGVLNCAHAALPGMIEAGWGRVITVVSDAGRSGGAGMAVYAASKAAAAGFSRSVAAEVARFGVTVNCIALGTMRTPLTAALWDDPDQAAQQKAILSGYLVRRPGEPEDVAWVVAMLASARASWITGQTIPVNGGFSFAL